MKKIIIINGPNLNLIGIREPEIYGDISFDEYIPVLRSKFKNHRIEYFQSNHEGEIIDKLQEKGFEEYGIVINAGAYTHSSIAIADAIRAIPAQVVEVHLSDLSKRESYRQVSFMKEAVIASISGMGMAGYEKAVSFLTSEAPS